MLFGHHSVLIVVGITRVTLERIPYNEQFNSFDETGQHRLGSVPFDGRVHHAVS